MGILDRFRRSTPELRSSTEIAELVETRDFSSVVFPNPPPPGGYWGFGNDAGVYVSEQTAMQHLAVFACVRLLADAIAVLPIDVFRKNGDSRVNLPTPPVLEDPDPDINGFEFIQQVVTSLALRGNSYELITARDKYEWPSARRPIHPDMMTVTRGDDGRPVYKIHGELIPRADVLHIRRLTLPGHVVGLSPIEQARQSIGLGLAAERFGARWFGDSADPSAVLESDANVPDAEAMRVMQSWVSSHGGRRHPAFLSGGLKYRPISITPEESQFLQTRGFQRGEIAMFFGIPPHMIGDTEKSTSWGTGIEQQSMGWIKFSLMPWLRCIEGAYSRVLLPRGQFMRFNVDAMLRGDTISRYTAYTQARNAGWLSVNEIRTKEDMDGIGPDGDTFIQPLNMAPLGTDPTAIPDPVTPVPVPPAIEPAPGK